MPAELANLDYDGLRDIRFNDDKALWRADGLPYEAKFFHVGRQSDSVRIHELSATGNKRAVLQAAAISASARTSLQPARWGDLGHAGFRIHTPLNSPAYKDELVVFLGASYFRALGAGQRYGLSARGLAIDTAGAAGGPRSFRASPTSGSKSRRPTRSRSPSTRCSTRARMTGAYRFDIRPGEQTVTEVHARVFMRAGAGPRVATLGLAPLTSMFFFGENQPRAGDFRPEVHDSDGLMMATRRGRMAVAPAAEPQARRWRPRSP